MAEKQEMACRRALRGACGGSNNAFTAGNGHHPGATPGTREEPGDRPLARVPGPGGRSAARREDQATGQPARRGRARPLHLIHGGTQRRRRLSPGSLSVSRTRRRQDHDERDNRQAPGDAGRLSRRACGEHLVPAVVGDGIQAQARSASCVPAASRKNRHADPLPASPVRERVTGFAVHNHVDHLCKTAPGLCAHWGNAGDRVTGPRP